MKSNDRSDRLDLESGLPTTAEDVRALRRVKKIRLIHTFDAYLTFLRQFPSCGQAELRSRKGPRGNTRFSLS